MAAKVSSPLISRRTWLLATQGVPVRAVMALSLRLAALHCWAAMASAIQGRQSSSAAWRAISSSAWRRAFT